MTLSHVLTADHCLWVHKDKNRAFNEANEDHKFKEVIHIAIIASHKKKCNALLKIKFLNKIKINLNFVGEVLFFLN